MISRQFFLALNTLERVQRQRRGEHIPAPLSVEVHHVAMPEKEETVG
jgi:hypothetical protein